MIEKMRHTKEERKQKKKEYDKKYYQKYKEEIILYQKEYYQEHRKKYIKRATEHNKNNKENRRKISNKSALKIRRQNGIFPKILLTEEELKKNRKERAKKYRKKYPNYSSLKSKEWRKHNKEYTNKYNREYRKNKLKTDINFKLAYILRNRLNKAIQNNQKVGSAVKDLGCDIPFLKLYLESLFQPGMTWDNWSRTGWHIDHIIPLDSFDLSNREEFLRSCHYTNLQPLWAIDNLKKGRVFFIS